MLTSRNGEGGHAFHQWDSLLMIIDLHCSLTDL